MLQSLFNARVRRAGQPWVALLGALLPWELPLPNPGFDVGLNGWTVTAPAGAAAHSPAPGAQPIRLLDRALSTVDNNYMYSLLHTTNTTATD